MDDQTAPTELRGWSTLSLRDIRESNDEEMAAAVDKVNEQVERHRSNLGGTGPPGRAD